MWPKAFSQLVELAPHISRLLPLADRFLQSKTTATAEEPGRRAAETVAAAWQAELANFSAAQAGFAEQMDVLGKVFAESRSDALALRTALEAAEARTALVAAEVGLCATRLTAMETRLDGVDGHLQRLGERVRLSPVVLLLVLTNLLLLAALVASLLRGR